MRIAHVDMDAFYVSVELQRRPELRGLPVVVAGSGPRAVVTTASYEARRFGVFSATPAERARRLCPDAVFIPPDFELYRARSKEVMGVLKSHVERVEVVGLDEAYLDLTGLDRYRSAARRVKEAVKSETGLTCSVGIGPNKLVAKVASDAEKPRGFVVLSREQARERFAASPPVMVPGIGPKTAERLDALGIATLAELAAAGEQRLAAAFGENHGRELRRRALFEHDGAVTTVRVAKSESRERTFDVDVGEREEQDEIIVRLAAELCERLERQQRRGRTVSIKVRLDDWTTVTRARTVDQPTNDSATVQGVALELLRAYAPARPVRLLGVGVSGLDIGESRATDEQLALPL
ncbi:MAG TPA: DNA polymerase IV [Solirubrobacteraceae bacterium]|nr:DNA polymerase IV [Solirubrobacteraceae bacterium]